MRYSGTAEVAYRRDVDGLRALSVLGVVLFHAGFETFRGGFVGVDVFFVISGFLIAEQVIRQLEKGNFSIAQFAMRRGKRILPALYVMMFATIPVAWILSTSDEYLSFSKALIATSFFVSNVLFWRESNYFNDVANNPLLHGWSLSVEIQYYVFFPILILWAFRGGQTILWLLLSLMFLGSLGLSQWGSYAKPTAAFYLLPTRIWEFLIGSAGAIYVSSPNRIRFGIVASEVLVWAGLAAIAFAILTYDSGTPYPGVYAALPTFGALAIIVWSSEALAVNKILGNRILVFIGLLSYSFYLWHQPVFIFAKAAGFSLSQPEIFSALFLISLILAYLSWQFVETPIRQIRAARGAVLVAIFVASSVSLAGIGALGYFKNGNLWRFRDDVTDFYSFRQQANTYVWAAKMRLRRAPFDESKIKILIIGDSGAGDFLNIVLSSRFADALSISSLDVYSECGNIYIERYKLQAYIAPARLKDCFPGDDLMSPESEQLIAAADHVFFASGWSTWELALVQESKRRLIEKFGKKFIFFGQKSVDFSPAAIIKTTRAAQFPTHVAQAAGMVEYNKDFRAVLGDGFIDPYEAFCLADSCRLKSENGQLLIYDGFHLSSVGAAFFAVALDAQLDEIFSRGTRKPYEMR